MINLYYLVLLLAPMICEYLNEKIKINLFVFRIIGIITVLIMITFRQDLGFDLPNYYNYYMNSLGVDSHVFEIGYRILNIVLKRVGLPFNALLFVGGFFNLEVMYRFLDRYVDKYKYIAVMMIATPFIYYYIMQTSILDFLSGYSYNLELYLTIQRSNSTNIIGAIMYMIMGLLWLYFVCEIPLFSLQNGVL